MTTATTLTELLNKRADNELENRITNAMQSFRNALGEGRYASVKLAGDSEMEDQVFNAERLLFAIKDAAVTKLQDKNRERVTKEFLNKTEELYDELAELREDVGL